VMAGGWLDGVLYQAPGFTPPLIATTFGCCLEGYTVDCISNGISQSQWIAMDYYPYTLLHREYMKLDNGTFIGEMIETIQNLDYGDSDFCAGAPSYNTDTRTNIYWGDYTFNPANRKIQFTH